MVGYTGWKLNLGSWDANPVRNPLEPFKSFKVGVDIYLKLLGEV